MSDIRDRIVAEALAVKDYRASDMYDTLGKVAPFKQCEDRGTGEAFRNLLGPSTRYGQWDLARPFRCWKDAQGKYRTEGVSTCGLVGSGILRRAGVRLPWNGCIYYESPRPYTGLDIVSELSALGINTRSRRKAGERPVPGDIVCIGSGLGTHVLTVVGWEGDTMVSVDGGQVDDAAHGFLQRVKVCRRKWQNVRVQWVIDVEKLHAALEGIVAPAETWTVEDTQTALNRHGAQPQLVVDGICGRNTRAAIVAFQRAHGLVPDGVVGPMTRAVLQA